MTLCSIDLSLLALPFTYFFTLPLCLIPFDRLPKHTESNINQYHYHYHDHHRADAVLPLLPSLTHHIP